MKLLTLLFFTFTLPLVIFLTVLLYGPLTPVSIKSELNNASVYEKLSQTLADISSNDSENTELAGIITSRFTSEYIKIKTEGVIDDTSNWITGKSTTPPMLSFKELKEDIVKENPQLLTQLTDMADEMKNESAAYADSSENTDETMNQQADMMNVSTSISQLVNSDFSFNLEKELNGIKNGYATTRIVHPILIVLLFGSILLLGVLSSSWPARLRWIGSTLISSSVVGFGILFVATHGILALTTALSDQSNEFVRLFSPIILHITTSFVSSYSLYEKSVSIVLLVIGIACIIGSTVIKPTSILPVKELPKKRSK